MDEITHGIGIALANTLGDHLGITFLMTGISAVLALIPFASEEEFLAQGAHNRLVELTMDEFVTVHLVHVSLAFPDRALSAEGFVWSSSASYGVLD